MATISISQLDTATQAKVDDLYEVAVVDENSQTGYASRNLTAAQIATLFAQVVQFSGLSTEAKTIIAAINEAAQNGGTEVEANPAGTPTDTLETIGIDGTVYEVGGSSEPVSKTATGNPIHIEDAADAPIVSGEVTFEPVQDLHGYDKPWAGGAGKNKLNNDDFEVGTAWNGDANPNRARIIIPCKANTTYTLSMNGTNNLDYIIYGYYETTPALAGEVSFPQTFTTKNNSEYIVLGFNKTSIAQDDLVALKLQLEEGSTATAWEPYSNECPIEGYTDCEVGVTGKNLCYGTVHGYVETTFINVNNAAESAIFYAVKGQTYTLSSTATMNRSRVGRVDTPNVKNSTIVYEYIELANSINTWQATWTGWTVWYKCNSSQPNFASSVQIELGSTATPYEPYQSKTYTIDLDGTRYGGTVDLVSGVMTVNRAIKNVTSDILVSEYLDTITQQWLANIGVSDAKPVPNIDTLGNAISNIIPIKTQNELYNITGNAFCIMTGGNIRITFEDCDTFEKMQSFVTNNPTQICYELATPFTVQLTPEQIRTLEGTNNISTNMTNMSLEYITQDYQSLVKLIERSAGHHYSEQERVVGTWFGKTRYEKVVDFGALPNATTKDLNHGIANVDTIFIVGGYAKNTTSGFVQQLNVPVPSNNQTDMQSQWYFGVTGTYIRCFTLTDRTAYDECKVILQYTKTTD